MEDKYIVDLDPKSPAARYVLSYAALFNRGKRTKLKRIKANLDNSIGNKFQDQVQQDKFVLTMPYGDHLFEFKSKNKESPYYETPVEIGLSYHQKDGAVVFSFSNVYIYEDLYLTSDTSSETILAFIGEAVEYYESQVKSDCIHAYFLQNGFWSRLNDVKKRGLDTIFIEEEKLNKIVESVDNFLQKKDRYYDYGVPYKKNFLLCGVPGTGKTSLVRAIASHFDLGIAYLSFSAELTDAKFATAMNAMPKDCILLLEDFDSLFIERQTSQKTCNISFSSILNILDGILTREKQITFITTNHVERLDFALKRASRIDEIIHFGMPILEEQISKMYTKYFPEKLDNLPKFLKKIRNKHNKLTPAILQHFFNKCYHSDDLSEEIDLLDVIIKEFDVSGNGVPEAMYM